MGVVNPNQVTPPEYIKVLSASTAPTRLGTSPLGRGVEGIYTALAATKVYGSNGPAISNDDAFIRHFVTAAEEAAVKKIFTATQFPALQNAFLDGGTLTRENNLRVVCEINGVPLDHKDANDVLIAGQFRIVDNASVTQIEFFTAFGEGTKIEIYINADADVFILNNDVDLPANQIHQDNIFLHLLAEDQIVNVQPVARYT